MQKILLCLLLLAPTTSLAALSFDISCDNVERITIIVDDDNLLRQRTPYGHVHCVTFFLKPEARDNFKQFIDAAEKSKRSHNAEVAHQYVGLPITANGVPLRNDILEIRGYSEKKVCTFILLEQDALAAARSVCPTLVPSEIFKVGKWE